MKESACMFLPHYKNIIPPEKIKLLLITEAPPLPQENYFYNLSNDEHSHGTSRSFFRGIMQGIGLLTVGVSLYSERKLLDAFLANGYFVIDSCPVPLVNEQGEQLPSSKKKQIMAKYAESLLETIKQLNPEKILFVCSTNGTIIDNFKNNSYISERILTTRPIPYPGVGWLRRLDKKGFMDLLPGEYRLSPIY
ncbi:hypothetical protein KIAC18_000325 [Sporomusa sphaeroides]|uniref:hypothetical protein n=1 Tax=Sporomusa sphaeroides TaxID=47679 RepID=UPI003D9FD367